MRWILNLCRSQLFRVAGAMSLSLSAVSFFVVTVGLVLLPADVQRLNRPLYLSLTHSQLLPGGQRAVSLAWFMPRSDETGWQHQLVCHDLASARPALDMPWPQLCPSACAPGLMPHSLLVGCWDGSLWQLDLRRPASAPQNLGNHSELAPHLVAASADGRWLAALGPQQLSVIDAHSRRTAWTMQGKVRHFLLYPDSHRMLLSYEDGVLALVDIETGRPLRQLAQLEGAAINATLSPGGRLLALVTAGGGTHVLDAASGESAFPPGQRNDRHLCRSSVAQFSPSGERLIFGGYDTTELMIWNVRTMQVEGTLRGHEKAINGVVFLDERRLASFGADGTFRIWDLDSRTLLRVQTIDVTAQAG